MPLPLRRWLAVAALALALGACDFTPVLDIETPAYEPVAVLQAVLAADSVATVWVSESRDPYGRSAPARERAATVTLLRDGRPVDVLAPGDRCPDYDRPPNPETGLFETVPCGPHRGAVPVEAGGTYTVRAEVEGLPDVEGTVTVPARPSLAVVEEASADERERRFRVTLTDPAGRGDRYALSVLRTYVTQSCGDEGCVEFEAQRFPTTFTTNDPTLLAAARDVFDNGLRFVTFPDETFDGDARSFVVMTSQERYSYGDSGQGALTVQLAALVEDVYDIYQITYFGGGDDNPFAEPVNLPSNVVGGYGLVGAVSVAEVAFEPPRARVVPLGAPAR